MSDEVMLVRHPEVALRWHGRCYGQSDVGLSRAGHRRALELARAISRWSPEAAIWSGLRRTEIIARAVDCGHPILDARWAERDFGSWEGRTWRSIYAETGSAMDRMITDPDGFAPGGGESTSQLVERALAAWADRPSAARIAIVSHGGPIAVIRAMIAGRPMTDLVSYVPRTGSIIRLQMIGGPAGPGWREAGLE